MKKIVLIYAQENKEYHEVEKLLKQRKYGEDCVFEVYSSLEVAHPSLKNADLLVSLDMEGFQNTTLLGNFQYNIMSIKQLHLILTDEVWKKYMDAEFAINVFVYAPSCDVDTIVENAEYENLRYYPYSLLETKEAMIDSIFEDFFKMVK